MSPTAPSTTSVTSLYLSNWHNLVGIWKASKLSQLDDSGTGPRLAELHYLSGSNARRAINQIVDYSGFFRDETNHINYTNLGNCVSEAWFESGGTNAGTLTTNYLSFQGVPQQPVLQLSRCFIGPPNQSFFVVRYTLSNPTGSSVTFNVLDQVHLNNLDSSKNVHAWYDPAQKAFIADMSASGQLFIIYGAMQDCDGYQAANNDDTSTSSATVTGWCSFDANGGLAGNNDIQAADVALAFNKRLTLAAGASSSFYFFLGVSETQAAASAAIATALAQSGDAWCSTTASAYLAWLANGNQGRRVHFDDDGLNQTFDRSLIMIKNVQNPVLGTFAATTNPIAYGYKNWARDASTTSIALDASGHFAEAELYWRWMASVQGSDGTWKTTYNTWDGSYAPFVEPEYDSVGAFLCGVYHHFMLTSDAVFLTDLWPAVKRAADWIVGNIQSNGFGQADYSIWEEGNNLEYNSYTQSWNVAGLYATQALAEHLGNTSLTEWYAGGASSILTALQRPSTWYPPGQWNPAGYYNRAVNADNTPRTLVDSSSDMLIALGVVDHESARAASHVNTVLGALAQIKYGIARYPNDNFYFTGAWSPGGNEALGTMPSWPQMSMWIAVYDILRGASADALARMQWCVSIFAKGYMPPGEAVSNVTLQPLESSMSEPLTASALILASLLYEQQFKLAIIPPLYNAGTYKSVAVGFGTSGDFPQWSNVPYFVGPQYVPDAMPACCIKRVYMTNDDTNLYLRVDNAAGSFPLFQQTPLFALHVYSQDFAQSNAPSSNLGIHNNPLNRPMSFMVERCSNRDTYQRYRVSNAEWTPDLAIDWVIAPQWDAATGRLEAVIPLSAVAGGAPAFGAYSSIIIVLVTCDPATNAWTDGDRMLLHYRLSTSQQPWTYGNIEQ